MTRVRLAITALGLSAVIVAGCSPANTGPRYTSCAEPMVAEKAGSLPDDLPLIDEATLTEVTRRKGFLAVTGVVTDRTVDDLYDPMVSKVRHNGFDVLAQENEGFEAEVYFSRRTDIAGIASLRRGPCPEQVTVSLVYDPLDTDEGRRVTAETRRSARS